MLNFREISGISGHDGRLLQPGTLFRSAAIYQPAEAEALFGRGLRHVVDLRSRAEAGRHRSALPGAGLAGMITHHEIETGSPIRVLRGAGSTPADSRRAMIALYQQLATDFTPIIRAVLLGMAATGGGVLVHCAVGKDRTGVTIAALLRLLGVGTEQIFEDYLTSNAARAGIADSILRRYPGVEQVDDPVLAPLVMVDADYLRAWFDAIGPFGPFLHEVMGLDAQTITRIRDRFLQ